MNMTVSVFWGMISVEGGGIGQTEANSAEITNKLWLFLRENLSLKSKVNIK
jgi:hypothetical protein